MSRGERVSRPLFAVLVAFSFGAAALAQAKSAEEFFIVSSVDLATKTMVLKRPTEVTLTMRATDKTRCRNEAGEAIRLSDLRAGDTVFIVSERDPSGQPVASSIREGLMTLRELQRRYLHPAAR